MARTDFGGQALLEGVLMRGRSAIGVALRHPDGSIVAASDTLNSVLHRNRFARAPLFLAGVTTRAALGGDQQLIAHLVEGLIRVAIFVGYLLLVSRSAEIRRVFQ